jgi:predicted outer membrane lipoprotein
MAACALLGAVVGMAGMLAHRNVVRPSGVLLPWGLLLGLATAFAVIRAVSLTPVAVRGAVACAAGWLLALIGLQRARPEGDFLVAGDGLGMAFAFGGMAVVAVAVARSVTRARA